MSKKKNPPKWSSVYPQGTQEGDEEYLFFIALARHPKWDWRSIASIEKESGLDRARIEEILQKYEKMGLIFQQVGDEDKWAYWERVPKNVAGEYISLTEADQEERIDNALEETCGMVSEKDCKSGKKTLHDMTSPELINASVAEALCWSNSVSATAIIKDQDYSGKLVDAKVSNIALMSQEIKSTYDKALNYLASESHSDEMPEDVKLKSHEASAELFHSISGAFSWENFCVLNLGGMDIESHKLNQQEEDRKLVHHFVTSPDPVTLALNRWGITKEA